MPIQQRGFNAIHSKTRVCIEHAFGVLKGRWKILSNINTYTIKRATLIIIACSVFHNICLNNNDCFTLETDGTVDENDNRMLEADEDDEAGPRKRDDIAQVFINE